MDIWDKNKRSKVMRSIRSVNTKPELLLRSSLHKNGYRFRIHQKDLPGKPDIVLKKFNTVIFVHGCFWHNHQNCIDGHIPSSNSEYWAKKLNRNVIKDEKNCKTLEKAGWKVYVVWECEIEKKLDRTLKKVIRFLHK